jgi:hypothetical protein
MSERFTDGSEQEQRSSVEITRNASGAVQLRVKMYGDDLALTSAEAQRVYDSLAAKYQAPAAKAGAR